MSLMTRPRALSASLLLLGLFGQTSVAFAQNVDIRTLQRTPSVQTALVACAADRERLCSGVMPGGGRIVNCLAQRVRELTPACHAALQNAQSALTQAGVVPPPPPPTR